jgi:hypothetical protein
MMAGVASMTKLFERIKVGEVERGAMSNSARCGDIPAVNVACIFGSGCLTPRMHLCTVPGIFTSSGQ